jgi:hypothetical protein
LPRRPTRAIDTIPPYFEKAKQGMHAETKVIRLLLAAVLMEAEGDNVSNMVAYLNRQRPSGSCGDGNFDRNQIALENEMIDKAIMCVRYPTMLTVD